MGEVTKPPVLGRPCKYCLAAYPILFENGETDTCEFTHRDDQRVYDLARKFAKVFQQQRPTDEQVGWFLDDADAVVDDFDPAPEKWLVRRLPDLKSGEFDVRMRINGVTYVCPPGGKDCKAMPVRLSVYRQQRREADAGYQPQLGGDL